MVSSKILLLRTESATYLTSVLSLLFLVGTTKADLNVTGFTPTANRLYVAPTAPVRIQFDRPLDPASVTSQTVQAFGRWSGPATGSFSFADGNRTLIYQPDSRFAAGETVTVTLSEQVRAADNSFLRSGGYTSQFWTASQRISSVNLVPHGSLPTGSPSRPYGGVATDLNNDGWLDITSVNEDSADLRVFMNAGGGTGTFQSYSQPTYSVGVQASPSEVADFNRDGNADISVANGVDGTISVLLGLGNGSFSTAQTIPVGSQPRGIASMDVDGDGDTDIVNSNQGSNNLSLLLNNGSGVFGSASFFNPSLNGEWSLAAGDMTNDGISDVVVGSSNQSMLQVLRGNGDGTFTPLAAQNMGGRSWMIAMGDVNGDGNLDVSSANANSNNGSILLGNGNGTFQAPTVYNLPAMGSGSNGFPLATDLGDMDGDGDLDWVTSSFNGEFLFLQNNGSGQFTFLSEIEASSAASCAVLFDMDNDGDLDMGLFDEIGNEILIRRNNGTPVQRGDFDADADLDAADINRLVQELATTGGHLTFDLTGDGAVDQADLAEWLVLGGAANLANGHPYLVGDITLDGVVDGSDFGVWNSHKFTSGAAWTLGDLNADGVIDGSDFGLWNAHKFMASDTTSLVPEPSNLLLFACLASWAMFSKMFVSR